MDIIDGKRLAQIHQQRLQQQLQSSKVRLKIVSILVGDDPASLLYTRVKQQKAQELGIGFDYIKFPETEQFQNVSMGIVKLNADPTVSGIMVQLPLSKEFLANRTTDQLLQTIDPQKDIDGLTANSKFLPATVRAVLSILEDEQIEVKGKFVVVVGASGMVGKPLIKELKKMGALVSGCDIQTTNLSQITKKADVLISAVGQANLIKEEMVKNGVVVIDVGINKLENGRVVGDVDFESVSQKASKITPVPGGVGPMTVISLMENAVATIMDK